MVLRFARERASLLSEVITEMILTIRTDEHNIYHTYSYRDNQICFFLFSAGFDDMVTISSQ